VTTLTDSSVMKIIKENLSGATASED